MHLSNHCLTSAKDGNSPCLTKYIFQLFHTLVWSDEPNYYLKIVTSCIPAELAVALWRFLRPSLWVHCRRRTRRTTKATINKAATTPISTLIIGVNLKPALGWSEIKSSSLYIDRLWEVFLTYREFVAYNVCLLIWNIYLASSKQCYNYICILFSAKRVEK